MDSCKWLYAYWINHDHQMASRKEPLTSAAGEREEEGGGGASGREGEQGEAWEGAVMRNSDVAENLGQVYAPSSLTPLPPLQV